MLKLQGASLSLDCADMSADLLAGPAELGKDMGDAELASMLEPICTLMGADALALHTISQTGELGPLIARVGKQRRRVDSPDFLCRLPMGTSNWLPDDCSSGAVHVSLAQSDTGGRFAVLACPSSLGILGRGMFERRIAGALTLIECAVSNWARSGVQAPLPQEQADLLNLLGTPILVIDSESRIRNSNAAAQALLSRSKAVSNRADRLTFACIDEAMRFQVLLRHAMMNATDHPLVCAIGRGGELPILLAVRAVPDSGRHGGLALVQMFDPAADLWLPLEGLARHYRWTQVECRLIEQLVVGKTLGEAATAMRLKEQTVRTYLKHIFQKTGLRRQIELIRLVLAGAFPKPACNSGLVSLQPGRVS